MKIGLFCIALVTASSSLAFAGNIPAFSMPCARDSAMGGPHAALADDFSSLFSNPAGFVGVKGELAVSELTTSLYGPLFDILGVFADFLAGADSIDLSSVAGDNGFLAGMNLGGPLSYGWVGEGLGFGFFNNTHLEVDVPDTTVYGVLSEDIQVKGGYAFRLELAPGHILDLGFAGKGFVRGSLELTASILAADELISGDIFENNPFYSTIGVGLDLGARYEFDKDLAVGLVCRDAYSPAIVTTYASSKAFFTGEDSTDSRYATIHPELDIGGLYHLRSTFLDKYTSKILFMADYTDIIDLFALVPRNPILNISLGTEVVVLDVLSLRAGIADALPHVGFGLDFTLMRLDMSIYGRELGLDPGVRPVYAMDISLLFRY